MRQQFKPAGCFLAIFHIRCMNSRFGCYTATIRKRCQVYLFGSQQKVSGLFLDFRHAYVCEALNKPDTFLLVTPFYSIVDIYTCTILVSLIVYVAVGNYAGRGVKKLDDYFFAGRRKRCQVYLLTADVLMSEKGVRFI